MRHTCRLAPLALVLVLAACASTATTHPAPGKADAITAVNARAAIDATETIRVDALRWAGGALVRGQITKPQQDKILAAGQAVEAAESAANSALAAYLATGTFDAQQALTAAVTALLSNQHLLQSLQGGH